MSQFPIYNGKKTVEEVLSLWFLLFKQEPFSGYGRDWNTLKKTMIAGLVQEIERGPRGGRRYQITDNGLQAIINQFPDSFVCEQAKQILSQEESK